VELKIFGDPAVFPDYSADLRRRAEGAPVLFKGPFDRTQLPHVYGSLDVLVVPSVWIENSPLVIHEAYMAVVPVVGPRLGGMSGLIRHGESGLLYEPNEPGALLAVLRMLVEQPDLLNRFRAQLPRVKTIAEDALEWEARYAEVLA
jgi:glycosyltransferase involved in cell wall biosynthesis